MVKQVIAKTLLVPVIKFSMDYRRRACQTAPNKGLCMVGKVFGVPPPYKVMKVIKREKTLIDILNDERDAALDAVENIDIDPISIFEPFVDKAMDRLR